MTKFDYSHIKETADRQIEKYGQTGTLCRTENSGQAWNPTPTKVDYPCVLVVLSYLAKDIDGTLVKSGDKKVYISAKNLNTVPKTTDKLLIQGKENTIISVDELNPAGAVIYYICQCRL